MKGGGIDSDYWGVRDKEFNEEVILVATDK